MASVNRPSLPSLRPRMDGSIDNYARRVLQFCTTWPFLPCARRGATSPTSACAWIYKSIHCRLCSTPHALTPTTKKKVSTPTRMAPKHINHRAALTLKHAHTHTHTSPMYFCTSSDPDTRMKVQSVWCATARARSVFPVPGGPYKSTPLGCDE